MQPPRLDLSRPNACPTCRRPYSSADDAAAPLSSTAAAAAPASESNIDHHAERSGIPSDGAAISSFSAAAAAVLTAEEFAALGELAASMATLLGMPELAHIAQFGIGQRRISLIVQLLHELEAVLVDPSVIVRRSPAFGATAAVADASAESSLIVSSRHSLLSKAGRLRFLSRLGQLDHAAIDSLRAQLRARIAAITGEPVLGAPGFHSSSHAASAVDEMASSFRDPDYFLLLGQSVEGASSTSSNHGTQLPTSSRSSDQSAASSIAAASFNDDYYSRFFVSVRRIGIQLVMLLLLAFECFLKSS